MSCSQLVHLRNDMQQFVTTRLSLLVRIRDASDAESWSIFVNIYAPLIFRYARRMGLQDADAADLTQEVLRVVSESIERFEYDPAVGRFRGWLKKVAFFTGSQMKKKAARQPVAAGDTAMNGRLAGLTDDADSRFWNTEYSRRLFELAAERVRPTVKPVTWDAFFATAVEDRDPAEVARQLGINVGSVYVARSRVYARICDALKELDER